MQKTHTLAHTHLNYAVPTSNMLVTYCEAWKSTYSLLAHTEGTAYTVYTWARYGDLPAPIWHTDPSWHPPLHGRRLPRQSIKPVGSSATGAHGNPSPRNIINSALANARMPLIAPPQMTPPTAERGAPSEGPYTTTSTATKSPGSTKALSPSPLGGWLNTLNPVKLRRVAGPYILYPLSHGMDDLCPGLRPGDPPCGHPCPGALFQPLSPQPAPLPGIYPNTVTGAKGVYLTTRDTTGQAIPLDQVHHMAMGPRLTNTDKRRQPLAGHGAHDPRPSDPNAPGPDRVLLHLPMKHTTQLPATLAGEKYFIVEGLTDDVITLAANTLTATTDAWDDAVGHPTARKDRVQETEDTLTADLVNHLVNPTGLPEQHNQKTEGPKVTDWTAFFLQAPGRLHSDTNVPPTHLVGSTMERHGHNRQSPHSHTRNEDSDPAGTGGPFETLHPPHQPPPGALVSPQNGDALDSGCPSHGHHDARDFAHTHSQPGSLHTKSRDSKGGTLDVLAHGHGTNSQTHKNTGTNFRVCTDLERGKNPHTASFKTATR